MHQLCLTSEYPKPRRNKSHELYKSALNFYTDSSGAAYQPGYFFSSDSLSLTSFRKSNPGFSPRLPKTIFNKLLYNLRYHRVTEICCSIFAVSQ